VAEITEKDLVIEIGPGVGSMTVELAKRAGKVVAVEIDKRLIPALEDNLGEFSNVDIINKDIMDVNINEFRGESGNVKVVANLPYYITTPIIMKLLEENNDNIDIMVSWSKRKLPRGWLPRRAKRIMAPCPLPFNIIRSRKRRLTFRLIALFRSPRWIPP